MPSTSCQRRADAEAEAAQAEVVGVDERLEEHARGVVAARVASTSGVREVVAALAVGDAVEAADLAG